MKPFMSHSYEVEVSFPTFHRWNRYSHIVAEYPSLMGARLFALMFSYWPGCNITIVEHINVLR